MARVKATIMLDRDKAARAGSLLGQDNTSRIIDIALDRLIRTEELRRDVAAYTHQPLDEDELAVGDLQVEFDLDDADINYDALYGQSP